MARRGENIHKRKDGRWEARIILKDKQGVSRKVSLYGKTYREAKEKKQSAQEICFQCGGKKERTFAETAEEWMDYNFPNLKKSTRLKYQEMLERHIIPEIGGLHIDYLDENMIHAFLAKKLNFGRLKDGSGLSSSYVKTMGIIVSSVVQYAVSKDYCTPLKMKIKKPESEPREIQIMDLETQKHLEKCLEYDNSLTALGIKIALNTGMRIGEICALKWEDIDMEHLVIHVRHTIARIESTDIGSEKKTCLIVDKPKTKTSVRDIPITMNLYASLSNSIVKSQNFFVVSGTENFISPRTFEYRYHRTLKKYSIQQINFHGLRHTFATRCVEFNVDIKSLSEILGHANVNITLNTYVHSSLETKRNQLEKLAVMYI